MSKRGPLFLQSADLKKQKNSADEKKPEGIYYIDLSAFESDSECENKTFT